jgi:hypothetical protein
VRQISVEIPTLISGNAVASPQQSDAFQDARRSAG